jgi:hypothetical protein
MLFDLYEFSYLKGPQLSVRAVIEKYLNEHGYCGKAALLRGGSASRSNNDSKSGAVEEEEGNAWRGGERKRKRNWERERKRRPNRPRSKRDGRFDTWPSGGGPGPGLLGGYT